MDMPNTRTAKASQATISSAARIRHWLAGHTALMAGLFLLGLVSRLPFQSHILYHWDSVNFAYALREFDVTKEQPQPPGYILYVGLCCLVNLVTQDAQTTMVSLSIAASALAVVALFCLGRSMFDRRTGLVAALCLASSPLFWFYGEIALPHTLDALLVIVSAWWLYETMLGHPRYLYPAVAMLAIAGGIRQQTLVFLLPLLLFALRRIKWQHWLMSGLLGAILCLAWFIPLMALNGGVANYMRATNEFWQRFQSTTSILMGAGWVGLRRNLIKLTLYTAYGWGLALVPAALYALARLGRREWPRRWDKPLFLFLWIAPTLIFYAIIHMGQQGLVFVFLPALLLISAAGLARLLDTRPPWLIAATVALVAVQAGIFCLAPEYPLGKDSQRLLTWSTLVNSDRYFQDRFSAIQASYAPTSTAILAANWHHVEYYLPAYKLIPFDIVSKWEIGAGQALHPQGDTRQTARELGLTPDASGLVRIVIFDDELAPFDTTPERANVLQLGHGNQVQVLTLAEGQALDLGRTFGVSAP